MEAVIIYYICSTFAIRHCCLHASTIAGQEAPQPAGLSSQCCLQVTSTPGYTLSRSCKHTGPQVPPGSMVQLAGMSSHRAGACRPSATGVRQCPWYPPIRHALNHIAPGRPKAQDVNMGPCDPGIFPHVSGSRGAGRPTRARGIHLPGSPLRPGAGGESGTHPSLLPPIAGHLHPQRLM